jgi:hypothetical protein
MMQIVQQTAAAACAPESGGGTAGGTAGGGGGGGDEEDMSHLCFLGDARVSLANGSSIALKDTSVGDRVWTASGAGWVTEVLVHPVNKRVPVIVVRTELGELVRGSSFCKQSCTSTHTYPSIFRVSARLKVFVSRKKVRI